MKTWSGYLAGLRPAGWKPVEADESSAVPETGAEALPVPWGG